MHSEQAWTEELLLQGLRASEPRAFKQLYKQYSAALYGIIRQIVREEEQANEVLQDAFVKIWKYIADYDESKAKLFTWMLNIARNRAIDVYRQKQKKSIKNTEYREPESLPEGQGQDALQEELIYLKEHVQTLGENQAKVLDLLYYKGYTQVEAAEYLDIPLGTVKSRLRLAIQKLQKIFQDS